MFTQQTEATTCPTIEPTISRGVLRKKSVPVCKLMSFDGLLESSHEIVSALYSNHVRSFPRRIDFYAVVFQADDYRLGLKPLSPQTTRPVRRAKSEATPRH